MEVCIERPFEKHMTAPVYFRTARIPRRAIQASRYELIITHTSLFLRDWR